MKDSIDKIKIQAKSIDKCCSVEGCNNNGRNIINGLRYCNKHKYHIKTFGYIKETIYDKNQIIKHENYAEIIVKNKQGCIKGITKIDLDDIDKIHKYKVGMYDDGYFYINFSKRNRQRLSRYILNITDDYTLTDLQVDHINRDISDNRKSNLRCVTRKENNNNKQNSISCYICKYKNIYYRTGRKKPYYYYIKSNKGIFSKYFTTEKEAYMAYVKKLFMLNNSITITEVKV